VSMRFLLDSRAILAGKNGFVIFYLLTGLASISLNTYGSYRVTLLENNPFRQHVQQAQPTVVEKVSSEMSSLLSSEIEYRGSFKLNSGRKFSLYFTKINEKRWLGINETFQGYKIVAVIGHGESLMVEFDGKQGILDLIEKRSKSNLPPGVRQKNSLPWTPSEPKFPPPLEDGPPARMPIPPAPDNLGPPPGFEDRVREARV
jgi:hypothetical protein